MANPAVISDADGEWIELFNPTALPIDINGWTLTDDATNAHTISNGTPLEVPAGGYLILGNNIDSGTNGNVNVAYQYSNFSLVNSGDQVVLSCSGEEVDRVSYSSSAAGLSTSLDPDLLNAFDNDLEANWCFSTSMYDVNNTGTPGSANDVCP